MNSTGNTPLHGTLIAHQGVGCLLLGESGAGKSRLAIECTMFGGTIIADDRVELSLNTGMLMGASVAGFQGVIEMRGVGLLRVPHAMTQHVIHCVVMLMPVAQIPRFAEPQTHTLLGHVLPLLHLPSPPHGNGLLLLAALRAVQEGRMLPTDWHPNA